MNDLTSPYVQAAAWLHGADPYSTQSVFTFWPREAAHARPPVQEFSSGAVLIQRGIPTAYPLTCFVLLAPLTLVPWHLTKLLFIGGATGLFLVAIYSLVSMARLQGWRRAVFIAASLLLAPVHTGIATCNLAIIAVELGVLAVWANFSRKSLASGLLLILSIGLKPQIGLCFLLFFILRRHWRPACLALAGAGSLVVIALVRMGLAHAPWIESYRLDTRALFTFGVLGDFTERNPLRFGLVNLQVALYPLVHNRQLANISAIVLTLALFAVCLALAIRMRTRDDLLCLSTLSLLSLLPVYHRFYDAALLLIPLAWLAGRLKSRPGAYIAVGALSISSFFIPGGSLMQTLRDRGNFPDRLVNSPYWNSLVMAHAVWFLLILAVTFLYHMNHCHEPGSQMTDA